MSIPGVTTITDVWDEILENIKNPNDFGQWYIEDETLKNKARTHYEIPFNRLGEGDWIFHMNGKAWVDMRSFVYAYQEACKQAGLKEIKLPIR